MNEEGIISGRKDIRFLVNPGLRIVMLFLSWIVGSILMLFVSLVLGKLFLNNNEAFLRISTVFQDILMWIVPALVTAMIITRQPARMLAIDSLPSGRQIVLGIILLLVSTPFMTWIIKLNSEIHLPESMTSLEAVLRALESNAEATVNALLGANTPGNLIVNILIVGIFAGFSEELFFRGALQRILASSKMSVHVAIWVSAFIFSAMHFQFFGFIPRMLLGAAFGYLLFWSGSVWLPMLIHALNNSIYVVLYSTTGSGDPDFGGGATSWVAVVLSIAFTIMTLYALFQTRDNNKEKI